MSDQTELYAADTLLEKGVPIQIVAPFLFRIFGKKTIILKLYQPYRGTLIRITRYWLQMGITIDQLTDMSTEEALKLHAEKGHYIDKIIACALLDTRFAGWLFTRPLAWYLSFKIKPKFAFYLVQLLVVLGGVEVFISTTRSVLMLRITAPKTGQKIQGS